MLLVLGSFGLAFAQTEEDYLQSLDGEASSLELDKETRATPTQGASSTSTSVLSSGAAGQDASDAGGIAPGMSVEQFEQSLKKNYIGSFLFYKRLSDSQKQEVYSAYQTNPDPASIRDTILKVSKK